MSKFGLPQGFFNFHLLAYSNGHMQKILQAVIPRTLGPDASMDLTGNQVFRAARTFIASGNAVGYGGIREVLVGNYLVFCFAGIADELSCALKYGVRVPQYCRENVCFFVVYAECVD